MSEPTPIWPYVVTTIAGIALFFGAIHCLVMTVRTTGLGQFYWAFNFVIIISVVSLLLAIFAIENKG